MSATDGMRPWPRVIFFGALGVCLFFMLWAAHGKGPWIDEAFSSYLARHDIPLPQIYAERWRVDVHPPLFSFLSWLVEPLTGDQIVPKRFLNLIPLGLCAAAMATFAIKSREKWIAVAALFAASSTSMLDTFTDHRMYFTYMAALFICSVGLAVIERGEDDYSARFRTEALIIAGSIIVGLNLQYVCGLFFGVILSVFILRYWFGGKRRWAVVLAVPTVLGAAILAMNAILQWSGVRETAATFWVHSSVLEALLFLISAAIFTFAPVAIAIVAALSNIRVLETWRLRYCATVVGGVTAALAVGLILNAIRPFIVRHYLFFIGPPLLVALAVLSTPAMVRSRGWAYAVLASCLLGCGLVGYRRAHQPQAAELADLAAGVVRRCPATQLVTAGSWQLRDPPIHPYKNVPEVTDWLYHLLAHPRGFATIHAERWSPNDRCPTIIWAENSDVVPTPRQAAALLHLPIDPYRMNVAETHVGSAGFAIVYPRR